MAPWKKFLLLVCLSASNSTAKGEGIVLTDPSNLGPKFVRAERFKDLKIFGISTTITRLDGSSYQILTQRVVGKVELPKVPIDDAQLTDILSNLGSLAELYPQTRSDLIDFANKLREEVAAARHAPPEMTNTPDSGGEDSETIVDIYGTTYKNVKIRAVEPDGLLIFHSAGAAKLKFTDLPEALQKAHNYDPEKAAAFAQKDAQMQAALRKSAVEDRAKMSERQTKKGTNANAQPDGPLFKEVPGVRSLIEIESDLSGFVDKIVTVQGVITIDSYYNYNYREARDTHFCFRIRDANLDSAHVYSRKDTDFARDLRAQLLDTGSGALTGEFKLVIPRERLSEHQTSVLATLVGYGPIPEPDIE